jgi:hypothetical protein
VEARFALAPVHTFFAEGIANELAGISAAEVMF